MPKLGLLLLTKLGYELAHKLGDHTTGMLTLSPRDYARVDDEHTPQFSLETELKRS